MLGQLRFKHTTKLEWEYKCPMKKKRNEQNIECSNSFRTVECHAFFRIQITRTDTCQMGRERIRFFILCSRNYVIKILGENQKQLFFFLILIQCMSACVCVSMKFLWINCHCDSSNCFIVVTCFLSFALLFISCRC